MFCKLFTLVCVCMLFALQGCTPTSEFYKGNYVSPEKVNELQAGQLILGEIKTFDLYVSYEYLLEDNKLDLTGRAMLGDHYQAIYTRLESLYVYLHFVDENSRVLETVPIINSLSRRTDARFSFARLLAVPAAARGFCFGYSGSVYEDDDGIFYWGPVYFHQLPLRRY